MGRKISENSIKRKKTIYLDEKSINDLIVMSKKYKISQREIIKRALDIYKKRIRGVI
jgi:hypothetical protein